MLENLPTTSRDNVPSLSVFMPMYNEKAYVERMVAKAHLVLGKLTKEYEVLLVDDGSTDGSAQIADALAAEDEHVRVVHHPRNLGYGTALRTGFANASKELVFYTDCDEPVDLNDLGRALALMTSDMDLVVGYRTDRHDTPRRWLYSYIYNALMRLLFGVRVRDVNFSFKLVRSAVLQRVSLRAGSTFIDGELLAEAMRNGFRIAEMPVEYHPRAVGHSSFDSLHAAIYAAAEMLSYLWRTRLRVSSLLSKVRQR
jgi:glycosyltransferase involved in cell wall biosynthesis